MGFQYGHFQKITGMQWINKSGKRSKQVMSEGWNNSEGNVDSFVTCSHDMGVFLWKHFGDRWSFSFIDVVKCFDQSLMYQRKQIEKST